MVVNWQSRKLIGLFLLLIIATTALFFKIMTAELWVDFMKWIFLTYVGGNVASKLIGNKTTENKN